MYDVEDMKSAQFEVERCTITAGNRRSSGQHESGRLIAKIRVRNERAATVRRGCRYPHGGQQLAALR